MLPLSWPGPVDVVMKTLEEHLDCEVFLRGNVLALDGDDDAVATARYGRGARWSDLVRSGSPDRARARSRPIAGALDRHESPSRYSRGRRPALPRPQGRPRRP